MKKIIVAGAGHGGLIAAAKLAKIGYDVTVYEKQQEHELGHDWEDRFSFSVLSRLIDLDESGFPEGSWRYRGDCAFVSPAKRKKIIIRYNDETRQKVMWRKPLIKMLVENAKNSGVKFCFSTEIIEPVIENQRVVGIKTKDGSVYGDLVIDAAGVFSPIRTKLPDYMNIEKTPRHGDLFYGWRAYFNLLPDQEIPDAPFEVYMCHEGEKGLSWVCTNENSVDVLIGRTEKLTNEKVAKQLSLFKKSHPWLGTEVLNGGSYGIIPVRRPLTLMVADGYAAVGDSAFMTTPMNGMGIDLSMLAGELLAKTLVEANGQTDAASLWKYNRDFHILYGGDTAKNEGLKNSILSLAGEGLDFLFESDVIQSSDLAGAGKNTSLSSLLGKFVRGMKNPKYFFTLIKGLMNGAKASKLYKKAPMEYSAEAIESWSNKISSFDIHI